MGQWKEKPDMYLSNGSSENLEHSKYELGLIYEDLTATSVHHSFSHLLVITSYFYGIKYLL